MTVNLESKTLIYNWFEERLLSQFEEERRPDGTIKKELHAKGHKGIITTDSGGNYVTTVQSSYPPPMLENVSSTGQRQQELQKHLYEIASSQVHEELHSSPPPIDYTSTTRGDYRNEGGAGMQQDSEQLHQLNESPLSYWSQNASKVTGITPISNTKTPFSKNTTFSSTIEESVTS